MKILKMKTLHRILLQGLLNSAGQVGGYTLSELNKMLKIENEINFKEEEIKELNLRMEDGSFKWNAKKDGAAEGEEVDTEKAFEMSDESIDIIKKVIKKKDDEKQFNIAQVVPIKFIAEQVGLEIE